MGTPCTVCPWLVEVSSTGRNSAAFATAREAFRTLYAVWISWGITWSAAPQVLVNRDRLHLPRGS